MTESKRIGDLFARYQVRLRAPQKTVEMACIEAIEEVLQFSLQPHQVSYTPTSRIIMITAPSLIKSEIKAREATILTCITKRLGHASSPVVIL